MRIVSLLPAATEIVCALGLRDALVGVSHECDYPPDVRGLPVLTSSALAPGVGGQAEIDAAVSSMLRNGESIYQVDEELLARLEPDLILTQALCDVCAVSYDSVCRAAGKLDRDPRIVSLEPHTLADIEDNILYVGALTNSSEQARTLVASIRHNLAQLQRQPLATPVDLVYLEWLDPFYAVGHWVPELIALAGGRELIGQAGAKSHRISWEELRAADPAVLVLGPCGFGVEAVQEQYEQSGLQSDPRWQALRAVRENRVFTMDANAYFSRPGPRLWEGAAVLRDLLTSAQVKAPATAAVR